MALTITEILRAVNPNIGLVVNPDGSYRIGVEDVNSDEILVAAAASAVDLAALEVINTAIQVATEASAVDLAAIEVLNTAINTALQAGGITQVQLAAMVTLLGFIRGTSVITPTTGTGTAIATLAPGAAFHFDGLRLHIGSALAAAETLTVTLDDGVGGAYDTVLFTQDLGTPDIRDVVLDYGGKAYDFNAADQIVIALSANAGADTWGCKTIHTLL